MLVGTPLVGLMLLVIVGLGTLGATAGVAAPAGAAQLSPGRMEDLQVELTLEKSGALVVREEFLYTLGPNEQHGFRRFVPLEVDYNDRFKRLYSIDGVRAQARPEGGAVRSGDPAGATVVATNVDNDNLVIRIGSVDTFVSGTWRYRIDYTVHDAVESAALPGVGDIEELAWNVVGSGWQVPIANVRVRGQVPAAPIAQRCYQGLYQSTTPCQLTVAGTGTDTTFELQAADLAPGQAATVYLDFEKGTVADATANLRERWSLARAFQATPVTLAGSTLATVAILGSIGSLLSRQGRDRQLVLNAYLPAEADPETEGLAGFFDKPDGPVQFRPPDGMTPGLCGVLVDERADPLDVSATIIDLAVRGYLRIEQLEDGADFLIRFLPSPPARPDGELIDYEQQLLTKLASQAAGADVVALSALRTNFATELAQVRQSLYQETMRRGWFRRRPDHTRGLYGAVGFLALLVGGVVAAALVAWTTLGLFALPLVLPGVLIVATAGRMPSRTAEGRRQLELCVGYERFLEVADAEQLRFVERQFDYLAGLPYAMVFGITHRWAQVLAVLQEQGMVMTPSWYVPLYAGGVFHYDQFGRSMSSFSSAASAALSAPQPSSTGGGFSGGGGGGGFSGGGGGGGGGGGW